MVGVLFKCLAAFLVIKVGLILLWLIQVSPLVLDHDGRVQVNAQLDAVHSVEVVKAHIIISVVVLQDDRSCSTTGQIPCLCVLGNVLRTHHQWQRVLKPVQLSLHICRHGEHRDELSA